MGTFIIMAASN